MDRAGSGSRVAMGVRRIIPYAGGGDLAASPDFYVEVLGMHVAMGQPWDRPALISGTRSSSTTRPRPAGTSPSSLSREPQGSPSVPVEDRRSRRGPRVPTSGGESAAAACDPAFVSGWSDLTGRVVGELVVVEPLCTVHEDGLFEAGHDREMWTYLTSFPNAS